MKFNILLSILCILLCTKVMATEKKFCSQALDHLSSCLALQSDFYDEISIASSYKADSQCISGVKFYNGILNDDKESLHQTYQVQYRLKSDPLDRKDEKLSHAEITTYCAGDIELKVEERMRKVSLVFSLKRNIANVDANPEINVEF